MTSVKAPGPRLGALLSRSWAEHTRSIEPRVLFNEVHPRTVLPGLLAPVALLLLMHFVPAVREFTGLERPWIPIALILAGGVITLTQWWLWERQRLVHVLCILDNCLYCTAVVLVMLDTTSPVRYAFGLLYAQMAAHYGNRYAFSWPLLLSICVVPFALTVAFFDGDYGMLALVLFGILMFHVNSTTTRHSRMIEREKERYQSAYELSDKVASQSLDIAAATSMAEVGNFAHQIRNATTPIMANVMILKELEGASPDVKESVESLERSSARVNELVEKLLSRLTKRAAIEETSFMLPDVLSADALAGEMGPLQRKKLHLEGPPLPFEIQGKPEHLKTAVQSLIQNACEAGASRVAVSAAVDGGLKRAIISVSDDGPGIPQALMDDLFRPEAAPAGEDHIGLGLPLSRRLVEVLGGTLRLAKTNEEGTSFEIVLPGRRPLSSRDAGGEEDEPAA